MFRIVIDVPNARYVDELADALDAAAAAREKDGDPESLWLAIRWGKTATRLRVGLDAMLTQSSTNPHKVLVPVQRTAPALTAPAAR
ncbi:hypothetical protein [Embleya sp. NBC_00896]|uniref:hypothetical protein n=1 Tax=Embleya sp. NBC_00896 TaxID=2975961 RepID=UPI002F918F00|nr:hypothetical protein OG928_48335 [Embleya sp. NBC_00896]